MGMLIRMMLRTPEYARRNEHVQTCLYQELRPPPNESGHTPKRLLDRTERSKLRQIVIIPTQSRRGRPSHATRFTRSNSVWYRSKANVVHTAARGLASSHPSTLNMGSRVHHPGSRGSTYRFRDLSASPPRPTPTKALVSVHRLACRSYQAPLWNAN